MKHLIPLPIQAPVVPISDNLPDDINRLKSILTRISRLKQLLWELRQHGFQHLPNSRRLKIQPKYRPTQDDPYDAVPSVLLCGRWLQQNGFDCHAHIRIIALNGLLIICKDDRQLAQPAGRERSE